MFFNKLKLKDISLGWLVHVGTGVVFILMAAINTLMIFHLTKECVLIYPESGHDGLLVLYPSHYFAFILSSCTCGILLLLYICRYIFIRNFLILPIQKLSDQLQGMLTHDELFKYKELSLPVGKELQEIIHSLNHIFFSIYAERTRLEEHVLQRTADLENIILQLKNEIQNRKVLTDRLLQKKSALRESESTARALMEIPTAAILLFDVNATILETNETFLKRLNLKKEFVIGRIFWDFFTDAISQGRKDLFNDCISQKKNIRFEDYRDGLWLDNQYIPILDKHGDVFKVIGFSHDITEKKVITLNTERLLERIRNDAQTKSDLIDEINHRVKNNLTQMLAIIQMEKADLISNPVKNSIETIQSILNDLENRIWGISEIHSILSEARWGPIPLTQLTKRTVESALSLSPIRNHIHLTISTNSTAIPLLNSRFTIALGMILNELATNSVKYAFTNRKQGRIEIQIVHDSNDVSHNGRKQVTVKFLDDGPGFCEDTLLGKKQNIGLQLIKMIAKNPLQGQVNLSNDNGAVVNLCFILPKEII
ncbi:MAG: PAS domain-containing protein [Desulfobacterales bacterium]|nr:PAS domain-containing protein [Desulfobacterales bacterium]